MKRLLVLAAALVAALTATLPAAAIVYGEPDGNDHPNVGALVAEWRTEGVKEQLCSGTLISRTVYLTAAHCTMFLESLGIPNNEVWVTFDEDADPITSRTKLYRGTWHDHPDAWANSADPKDLAVVVFDKPIKGLTPASLPTAGLFDQMKKAGTLDRDTLFTSVGYGVHEPEFGAGGPTWPFDGERWRSVGSFNALNKAWLRISQNDATSDGGTCYGDSGGPNFLGAHENETDIVASITVTGDFMCVATNDTYRLDTASARAFIGQFVALP